MNKVVQLKDENNNNILPIGFAQGGVKMDLLWTNPNIASSFSPQTITINNLSEYQLLIFEFNISTDSTTGLYVPLTIVNYQHSFVANGSVPFINQFTQRSCEILSNGVSIGNGNSNGSTNNSRLIPVKIYGIKTAWVVPTEVNSLQYEEDE